MRTSFARMASGLALLMAGTMVAASAMAAVTTFNRYDSLGRVLLVSNSDGTQTGYSYDQAGNRSAVQHVVVPLSANSQLTSGQGMVVDTVLQSPSHRYSLVVQEDGNLSLYGASGGIWGITSSAYGKPTARAVMQADGNFVVLSPTGTVYWSSGTGGHPGAFLQLQDDGNLVVYSGTTGLWSSNTACGLC